MEERGARAGNVFGSIGRTGGSNQGACEDGTGAETHERHTVSGDADEEYIRCLANFIDDQMRRVAEGMNTTTPSRLAVLTALNLAHQLFELEKKRVQGEADIERRMMSLMASIEEEVPTSLFR